jgi:hypothetical protein
MSAAGALGYRTLTSKTVNNLLNREILNTIKNTRKIVLPLNEVIKDVVGEEMGREERLDFSRDKVILTFRKDARGKFHVEVSGPKSMSGMELRNIGKNFAGNIIQQFAHHRLARELDERGIQIVDEEVNEKGDIILQTRKWN